MASLYVTSNNARKVVVVILGVFIAIILIDTFIRVGGTLNPGPSATRRFYLDPDRKLGDITAPNIPAIDIDTSNATYAQESAEPVFPDVSYVYAIEQPREKLNTLENANKTASSLGFTATGFKSLGNNDYSWTIADQTKTLKFNKLTQIWSFSTIYENNTDAKKKKTMLQDINSYSSKATTLLNSLLFSSGLGLTSPQTDARYIIRTEQGDISETTDYKLANYVKLNVYRKLAQADLKETKDQPKLLTGEVKPQDVVGVVYKTDPRVGEFSATVSNDLTNLGRDIFEMKFVNYEYGAKGNYYIVTAEEAFSRIQKGQGSLVALSAEGSDYFANYTKILVNRFIIDARKTTLGFYEPDEWTGYTYPIYIFTGRAELSDGRLAKFTYYVDAIKRLDS